jgi:hypothetical protein
MAKHNLIKNSLTDKCNLSISEILALERGFLKKIECHLISDRIIIC